MLYRSSSGCRAVSVLAYWLAVSVFVPVGMATVVINEVMSSNNATVADGDGDYSDWLELFNTGASPVNLDGWGLSDRATGEARWFLPGVTLGAGQHLMVWASGKNRRQVGSPLHTDFSISGEGETITLTRPDGTVADVAGPVAIRRDFSYGRAPSGASEWRFFDQPTPGTPNPAGGFAFLLPKPRFDPPPGFHPEPVSVTFESDEPGVLFRYTLDGSTPTSSSPIYTGAIPVVDRTPEPEVLSRINTGNGAGFPLARIAKATTIRVRGFKTGAPPSEAVTGTYFIGPALQGRYNKPVVSIVVDQDEFFGAARGIYVQGSGSTANWSRRGEAWEREIHLEMFEPDGRRVLAQQAGARIHGGASRSFAIKSLRLYARSSYGESRFRHAVFPDLPYSEYNRLLLRNGGNGANRGVVHDGLMHEMVKHMRFDTLAYRPAVVFINGEYWGIKNFRERYDRHYLARVYGIDPDNIDLLTHRYSVKEGTDQHYRAMLNYMGQNDLAEDRHYREIQRRMDTDNFMDYQIAQIFINNTDWPGNNIDFWRVRKDYDPEAPYGHDGRWRWLLFDTDFGFGLYYSSSVGAQHNEFFNTLAFATAPNGPTVGTSNTWPNPPWSTLILRMLLRNPEFRRDFINRFADQLNSAFLPSRLRALHDHIWEQTWPGYPADRPGAITPDRFEHTERWPNLFGSWGAMNAWNGMRAFSDRRRGAVLGHIQSHFGLAGQRTLTLNRSGEGVLRVNTLTINASTLGLPDPTRPYPWTGTYFSGVPVTVTAQPAPGHRFERWLELPGELEATVTIDPAQVPGLTARFVADPFYEWIPAHRLSEGPYRLEAWPAEAPAGTYPKSMVFEYAATEDPPLGAAMSGIWSLPYNLNSRSRVNGLNGDGVGFLNTGGTQEVEGSGFLGSARLALNTVGRENIRVWWKAGTVLPNDRVYALRLQYRVGSQAPFQDLVDNQGNPYEYIRHVVAGHESTFGPVRLPVALENVRYVELRWRYHYVSGTAGARAFLRLDDILIESDPSARAVRLISNTALPATITSGESFPAFSVQAVSQSGTLDSSFTSPVSIRVDGAGALAGPASLPAVGGVAIFESAVLRGGGTVALVAQAEGLEPVVVKVVEVRPAPGLTYNQWREAAFPNPADRANESISGPKAVSPGGQYRNLLRYAFEATPGDPGTLALPRLEPGPDGGIWFCLPYLENRTGVAFLAEAMDDRGVVTDLLFDSRVHPIPPDAPLQGEVRLPVPLPSSGAPVLLRVRLVLL